MKTVKVSTKNWNKAKEWPRLVESTACAAGLTKEEKERLKASKAAELVAATAYIAGCREPKRIALAHLTTFMAAVRCPHIFGHKKGETLAQRLEMGNHYPGGNKEAVKACMLILEMISLNDHKRDFKEDLIKGKFNPLAYDLNYDEAREKIEKEFESLPKSIQESYNDFLPEILASGWI